MLESEISESSRRKQKLLKAFDETISVDGNEKAIWAIFRPFTGLSHLDCRASTLAASSETTIVVSNSVSLTEAPYLFFYNPLCSDDRTLFWKNLHEKIFTVESSWKKLRSLAAN